MKLGKIAERFELDLRFFPDYLADSVYFKLTSPEQDLQRAQVQFRFCESIETLKRQIKEVLALAINGE
jgi:hypothetical protein